MIKKTGKGFKVESKTGKNLGEAKTLAGAKKRMQEVEFFKHQKKGK